MATRAVLMDRDLRLHLGERELTPRVPGEVLVAVEWAGLCGSDLHVMGSGDWVAYWPATLGHEVAGRVLESDDPALPAGTAVVLDSRMPCGDCDGCGRSSQLCEHMAWLGEKIPGGYADALTVPAAMVHQVPARLDLADAVLAEPLAVVMSALDRVGGTPRSVLVLGYGPIGALTHLEVANRWPSAEVSVVEPSPGRAGLAAARGALVVGGDDERFDLVVDAAGYPASLTDAIDRASTGGTVLLVALSSRPAPVLSAAVVERSLTITGSVGFAADHLARALARLADDPEGFREVVSHRVPLAEFPTFLAGGTFRTAGKVLVRCGSAS